MNRPSLTTSRTTVQLLVVLAFIIIPILNRNRYSLVYGNFLAFHFFYIPLVDPLAALQLTVKNLYLTLDNIIGTLIPLAVAYYLGTVFCSWICPFGFFSHWTFRLSRRIFKKKYRGLPLAGKGFALKLKIFLHAWFFRFSLLFLHTGLKPALPACLVCAFFSIPVRPGPVFILHISAAGGSPHRICSPEEALVPVYLSTVNPDRPGQTTQPQPAEGRLSAG